MRRYSDAELAAIIRTGVRPDGRSVIAMPSDALRFLTDEDLGDIVAYLRSVPPVEGAGPEVRLGPLIRLAFVTGQLTHALAKRLSGCLFGLCLVSQRFAVLRNHDGG